jgi:RNA polymerase sigma factor (sigma-70 family)
MRSLAAQVVRQLPSTSSLRLDGDLLASFLNDGAEDDFAELVRRHGPLVWGVCRRALPDAADAEDAFQATFLVLLRRGRKLTGYPTIGPWLHKVAAWTARNVRRRNARRLARQSALPEHIAAPATDRDLPLDIDAALLTLPEKFRSPIVLCHLLGLSRADAAERLGCAEGTLSAWLSRGLARLRAKFGGLDPARPLGVAAVAVPAVLSTTVVRAATGARLAAATTAAVSSTVSQVVEGVIRMFWIKKAAAASMAACVVFALGVGVGMSGRMVEGVAEGQEMTAAKGSESVFTKDYFKALDNEIADVQRRLEKAMEVLRHADFGVQAVKQKIKLQEARKDIPESQKLDDLITLSRFEVSRASALAEVRLLKDKLDKLKDSKALASKPIPRPDEPKTDLERIDRQLVALRRQWKMVEAEAEQIKATADAAAERFRLLDQHRKAIDDQVAKLLEQRNEIVGKKPAAAAKSAGYLELIVRGTAPRFEFALREFDANGKEIGTAVFDMNNAPMLARVLARTKADATAPTELRVLAAPPTALGGGPHAALKACDAAGYKTVKFTGYVVAGGFAPELKIDDTGEQPGYKSFNGAERKVTDLIKEIEDGMRSF